MVNHFQILTVTHQNLNINEIGQFAIPNQDEALKEKLHVLKLHFGIDELNYVSTCNRVSFLFVRAQKFTDSEIIAFFKLINPNLKEQSLDKFVNHYFGEPAIQHYFEVAASIDSLVVGEREIFRQLRVAYDDCKSYGLTGDNLRLFHKNLVEAAKEVYAKTKIGEKPLSVVSLAIRKIKDFQLQKEAKILLIGSGETNTLVGKFLKKNEYKNITIFNRSLDNAQDLSRSLDCRALHLSELENYKEGFDCIIVCTSSIKSLVNTKLYSSLLNGDQEKKLLVDLAVPRNIDLTVVEQFNVEYVEIEMLRSLAEKNLEFRKLEVHEARIILDQRLEIFKEQLIERQIERAMKSVPIEIKAIKEKAIHSVYKKEISNLDPKAQALVFEMLDYMEKKCISVPMKAAKAKNV